MKKVEIDYKQLIFLYAYLRQLDLSLDRSRWGQWNELKSYYSGRIMPAKVIQNLQYSFNLPETDLQRFSYLIEKRTLVQRLKYTFAKKVLLREEEIIYCCKLLWLFEGALDSNISHYNSEIEQIRTNVAEYYTNMLKPYISNKDLDRLMRIEHFEQNNKLDVVELDEFVPELLN